MARTAYEFVEEILRETKGMPDGEYLEYIEEISSDLTEWANVKRQEIEDNKT